MSSVGELDPAAEHFQVPMRDGIRLWSDAYLPATGPEVPVPVVLIRLPYGTTRGYTYMPEVAKYLAARGYAVVVQDVRGRFRSEGERTPWIREREDAYDTLEWLCNQTWCDGSVGMIGNSYYGFTQWAAAATDHPALKAVVPRYTSQSIPPAPWFSTEGVVSTPSGTIGWLAWMWSEAGDPGDSLVVNYNARPLTEGLGPDLDNARRLLNDRLLGDPGEFETAVFGERGRPAPRMRVPALHVAGWWDNCKPYQLADWAEVTSSPASEHQFLHVDATDHRDVRFGMDGTPDPDYLHGDDEALARYLPRMLEGPIAFFDHYLRGAAGAAPIPRVRYRVANGQWRVADSWPPAGTHAETLSLGEGDRALLGATGGTLRTLHASSPAAPEELVEWVHDPDEPVPSLAEDDFTILMALPDEVAVHARPDVATFTTLPASQPFEIIGDVHADLAVATSAPASSVVATLCDVAPDGRAWMIVEGAAHFAGEQPSVRVDLGSTAYRVLPGHALRLAISSSRHPRYVVDPGTGESPWHATTAVRTQQLLRLGGDAPSSLTINVMTNTRSDEEFA